MIPKNWVGLPRSLSNRPKADLLIRDVAGLSIDTPPQQPCEIVGDPEIFCPPTVVVRYHQKDVDVKDIEWVVIQNQRFPADPSALMSRQPFGPQGLLRYFPGYKKAVEAHHSRGLTGMSLLVFEDSPMGYVEAERLHKHFADQGTGRDAWEHHMLLLDGTRHHHIFGYMANREDIDIFNQRLQATPMVKFETTVVMRETREKNRIVTQGTRMQPEQNKEELPIVDSSASEELRQEEISELH